MDAASTIRAARSRAGLSLRALADRAGTSHATLSRYEHGLVCPTVDTLDRIVRACGYELEPRLRRTAGRPVDETAAELEQVLLLAEQFPARHASAIEAPPFPPRDPPP